MRIISIILSLLLGSGCAVPRYRLPEGMSDILAKASEEDRKRCEDFAATEVGSEQGTFGTGVSGAIDAAGRVRHPVALALFLFSPIFGIIESARGPSEEQQAVYEGSFKECLELSAGQSVSADHRPHVAKRLYFLANRFSDREEHTVAERFYRRALEIQEKTLGPEHADLAGTLWAYSRLLARLDRPSEAEAMMARINTPFWSPSDIQLAEEQPPPGQVRGFAYEVEVPNAGPFYKGAQSLKYHATYPDWGLPGQGLLLGDKPILFDFGAFRNLFVYHNRTILLGAQTRDKSGRLLAEARLRYYVTKNQQQGVEAEEVHYSPSGKPSFYSRSEIDTSDGIKIKESNTIGRKTAEYYLKWPALQ